MLNLYLLRHGKARTEADSGEDFDRKLNKKGTAQANQIGLILRQKEARIDQIISSGAARTTETAEIVNHFIQGPSIEYHDDLYLAGIDGILHCLNHEGKGKNLLYVGHNFGISDIVGYLSGENMSLSTCQLVHIRFALDDWKLVSRETGIVQETIVPDVLTF